MYDRFAIYYTPAPEHALAQFGAAWLGWDVNRGVAVAHPDIPDLPHAVADLTSTPRKYGFHGTLKAPFYLAEGIDLADLQTAVAEFAARRRRCEIGQMAISNLGSFVALVMGQSNRNFADFVADCVKQLDRFRAPMTQADLERRRAAGLTEQQDRYLRDWGYPYVLDAFRFHLTLTGRLPQAEAAQVARALAQPLADAIAEPLVLDDICLCGQMVDGRFKVIARYPLSG